MEKNEIEKLINENLSIREISDKLNVSYSTIRYWLNKFNLNTNGIVRHFDWDEEVIKTAIEKSECKTDVLRNLNIKIKSGNYQTLDRYLTKYKIDTSKLVYDNNRGNRFKIIHENDDVFCEHSTMSTKNIKRRIINQKLLEYKCSECSLVNMWNGKLLNLQLDHINGINNDNKLENLRFLCPNCHSQTETYCSRNIKNGELVE